MVKFNEWGREGDFTCTPPNHKLLALKQILSRIGFQLVTAFLRVVKSIRIIKRNSSLSLHRNN